MCEDRARLSFAQPAENYRFFAHSGASVRVGLTHLVAGPIGMKLGSDCQSPLRALRAASIVFCSSSVI